MADRFANGDPANDRGGTHRRTGSQTGFDPTDKGFFHGGDIAGLSERARLHRGSRHDGDLADPELQEPPRPGHRRPTPAPATTATGSPTSPRSTRTSAPTPSSRRSSTRPTRAGIKVFFDIITNHTADVIDYAEGQYAYVSKATAPYRDAAGNAFDDRDYAGGDDLPGARRRRRRSPTRRSSAPTADATVKVPAWLNDPTHYHNRGDSTFAGESSTYGDFFGLDDLFTEQPEVVDGHDRHLRDVGRLRHRRLPHRHRQARQHGVLAGVRAGDARPRRSASATTTSSRSARSSTPTRPTCRRSPPRAASTRPSTSASRARGIGFAKGAADHPAARLLRRRRLLHRHRLQRVLAADLPRQPRHGPRRRLPRRRRSPATSCCERDELAHALMYLTRGQPVVYYGDEQGFTGDGGDKDARQDMFASQVASYNDDDLIGTDATTAERQLSTPATRSTATIARPRRAARGPPRARRRRPGAPLRQQRRRRLRVQPDRRRARTASTSSRVNNATDGEDGRPSDLHAPTATFTPVWPASRATLRTDDEGRAHASPSRRCRPSSGGPPAPLAERDGRPGGALRRRRRAGGVVGGRAEITRRGPRRRLQPGHLRWRPVGTGDWTAARHRRQRAVPRLPRRRRRCPKGTLLEYRAVLARQQRQPRRRPRPTATVGDPAAGGGPAAAAARSTQPDRVSMPGTPQLRDRLPGRLAARRATRPS